MSDAEAASRVPAGELESRLVWILGGPRTGSTWLLELLTHPFRPTPWQPTGAAPIETRHPWRRLRLATTGREPRVIPIDEPYLAQHLEPLVPLRSDPADLSKPALMTLNETRGKDPSYFFSERFASAWRPALRELILRRFAAQVESFENEHGSSGLPVLIKEPNGSYGAELTMSLLPAARMIFLLRDPRDVIDSFMDAMSEGGWLSSAAYMRTLATAEDRLGFARSEARSWLERTRAVMRAYDSHPEALRYRLSYEDLRADPEPVLRGLLEWLGDDRGRVALRAAIAHNAFESIPDDRRGIGKIRRAATPGLWRERLSAAEQEAIEQIAGPTFHELGYGD